MSKKDIFKKKGATKGSAYFWVNFLNKDYNKIENKNSKIETEKVKEIYNFKKENELVSLCVFESYMSVELQVYQEDGMIMNKDWNNELFLKICEIAGPNRNILSLVSVIHNAGYDFIKKNEY